MKQNSQWLSQVRTWSNNAACTSTPSGTAAVLSMVTSNSTPPRRNDTTMSASSMSCRYSSTSRGTTPSMARISSPTVNSASAAGEPGVTAITRGGAGTRSGTGVVKGMGNSLRPGLIYPPTVPAEPLCCVPMSLEQPTIESLRSGDEPAKFELSRQAFGSQDPVDLDRPRPTNDRIVAAYDGDTIVGCVTLLHDAQYFGSQPVTSGGIASVSVAAHARGRNVARRMMREALDRLHAGGCAISALYPTTASLYRSVGYEIAGHHGISQIDIADLPRSAGTVTFTPASIGDLRDAYDAVAFTHDGWLVRNDARWTIVAYDFHKSPQPNAAYLAHRDGRLVGGLA